MQSPGKRKRTRVGWGTQDESKATRRGNLYVSDSPPEERDPLAGPPPRLGLDDEDIPLDEMFSCMFHQIRTMRPEMAVFWACAIDRRGIGERLWKCLCIFSFRDIGYAYPEAPCYVHAYYCTWLEEMRRYRQELRARLEYACTKSILSILSGEASAVTKDNEKEKKKVLRLSGIDQAWVSSFLEMGMISMPEEALASLMEDIQFHMQHTPNEYLPFYETPCSCDALAARLARTRPRLGHALFEEGSVAHLNTARHLLINVVQYLCVLPKSTLSRDMSFYTAFKCIGTLTESDWGVSLSFAELDQALYAIRKGYPQAVQQACICLCGSIIHKDERRAVDMTDLFSVWNEGDLFWKTLFVIARVFPVSYQWTQGYLKEYQKGWAWAKDCTFYFVEGSRSAMFSGMLLFIRGRPQRDLDEPAMSPNHVAYSKDYAAWFYGGRTPSYQSLDYLNAYEKEIDFDQSRNRVAAVLHNALGQTSGQEDVKSSHVEKLAHLVRKMIQEFPGSPSSGTEPYAVKNKSSLMRRQSSTGWNLIRSQSADNTTRGTRMRIGKVDREVCITEHAIDWSTRRGREMCRGVRHAFLVSESVSRRSLVSNAYFEDVEKMLTKQCKKANKARREDSRRRRIYAMNHRERALEEFRDVTSSSQDLLFSSSQSSSSSSCSIESGEMSRQRDRELDQMASLQEKIYNLTINPWYDPGLVHLYRNFASELVGLKAKVRSILMAQGEPDPAESGVFSDDEKFLLNTFDVEEVKGVQRIAKIGNDDWLEKLHQLENQEDVVEGEEHHVQETEHAGYTPATQGDEETDSSSELSSIAQRVGDIRLSSSEALSEPESEILSHSQEANDEDLHEEGRSEEGSFGEDMFYWQRLIKKAKHYDGHRYDARLSVAADWPNGMIECCLTIGPFRKRKDAFRLQNGYELASYLGHGNMPTESLFRWTETIRRLVLQYRGNDGEEVNLDESYRKGKGKRKDDKEERETSVLDNILDSMSKVHEERQKAFIPQDVLRERRRQELFDSVLLHEGIFGLEDGGGMLVDTFTTVSSQVVTGYDACVDDMHGWFGPYRSRSNSRLGGQVDRLKHYLQYRVKLCSLLSSCTMSWPIPLPIAIDKTDPIDYSVWLDILKQGEIGRSSCFNTPFARYLAHYFYRVLPMQNSEWPIHPDDALDELNNVPRWTWTSAEDAFEHEIIPFEIGKDLFFNMVLSFLISGFPSIERALADANNENGKMADVFRQMYVECVPQEQDVPSYAEADEVIREAKSRERLDQPLVLLDLPAVSSLICLRIDVYVDEELKGSKFFEDTMAYFKQMKEKHEEEGFWTSMYDCVHYFIHSSQGQGILRHHLTEWRDKLSRWMDNLPEETKERMDALVNDIRDMIALSGEYHETSLMDYVAIQRVIDRIERLLCSITGVCVE